jgi:hypothetical protein
VLRLTTFGGVRLTQGREDLTGAATQPRRLAILARLAVAGDRGVSRDKLLALLWPESEMDRARHVLNQLLYAQRQLFDEDSLFLGKKLLRLNPTLIWTDVAAFEVALSEQRVEDALGYHHGPFLDGFFLGNASASVWRSAPHGWRPLTSGKAHHDGDDMSSISTRSIPMRRESWRRRSSRRAIGPGPFVPFADTASC